jgi:hypothetical protein
MNFPYFADSEVESDSLKLSSSEDDEIEAPFEFERQDTHVYDVYEADTEPETIKEVIPEPVVEPTEDQKLERIKQRLIEACCTKTQSMFSVVYILYEHYSHCNDFTPKKRREIKQELLERIQETDITKSRLKLVETILGNFFQ